MKLNSKKIWTLLISLSLLKSSVLADTTNNLVSQDFTTGWTNTGNTYHGSGTIAGHHGGTVESDAVSLNAEGINKESLNEGFTVTGGADIWFWNDATQSVTQTIKTVDDNGGVLTQSRTISGSCATLNGCSYSSYTDQLIVSSNTQQDYDVSLKFAFSESTNSTSHWAADLKNPSLIVDYTYVAPLDTATQNELFELAKDMDEEDLTVWDLYDAEILTEEFKQDMGVEYVNDVTGEVYGSEPPGFEEEIIDEPVEMSEEEIQDEEMPMELAEVMDEEASSEGPEEVKEEESDSESTETAEATDEGGTEQEENVQKAEAKATKLDRTLEKIDEKIKEVDKNLELKHLAKINAMVDNSALLSYNIPFYKEFKIYEDQLDITDNRQIYAEIQTLSTYTQNDPIFIKQSEVDNIRLRKQQLIREIEVLKNG